jgi:hypothetical protein
MAAGSFPRVNGVPVIPEGTGTALAIPSGVVRESVSTAQTGTAADTNETDLYSYSLPANTLSTDGKIARVTVWGSFAANGNAKTIKGYFNGDIIVSAGTSTSGQGWRMVFEIIRTGATAQISAGEIVYGNSGGSVCNAPATSSGATTGALIIKMTGQNGTASANDIVRKGAFVEILN